MDAVITGMKEACHQEEIPVVALIYDYTQRTIIATSCNSTETDNDASAHAEINVINKAKSILQTKYLYNYDIYVSLEPCPMCAYAIALNRTRRLYFCSYNTKYGAIDNNIQLYNKQYCNHIPETFGGIRELQASAILRRFFQNQR